MTDATSTTKAPAQTGRDYKETLFLPKTDFPMRAGLPKAEPTILQRWDDIGLYQRMRKEAAGREKFTLHDGPPYANGHLHIGHALNKILKDLVTRSRQSMGYDAPYVPGWDCHGLPIEWKVEEAFRAKGKAKDDVPPAEFVKACREYAAQWIDVQREEFKRLGVVGDWDNPYVTMDPPTEAIIVSEFLKFVESGQVYRGSKPVMWSPVERTALAEAEVEYHEHQSHTIWVKFPVVAGPKALEAASIVIWTTTPWTIPGNRAVSYGPSLKYGLYRVDAIEEGLEFQPWAKVGDHLVVADKLAEDVFRAAKVATAQRVSSVSTDDLGKAKLAHPFRGVAGTKKYFDFDVPLLAGDHVTDEAGTGFVHTAPSHGQEDFAVWMEHGLGQDNIPDMVDDRGAYYDHVPLFAGMRILRTEGKKAGQDGDANPAVIKALIEAEALLARGRLKHSYPHSWRSKAPLIFRNTPQWFIRLGDANESQSLRASALKSIERDVAWHPPSAKHRLSTMVSERPDWLVSRQRTWGVPLTLFVHKQTGEVLRDAKVNERIVRTIARLGVEAWRTVPTYKFLDGAYPAKDYEKINDILDVWFDSGCTHAFTLEPRKELPWPADVYLEGSDQHRGWFQSSLLESCGTRGRAPYSAVVTHGFFVDEDGKKISKSDPKSRELAPDKITSKYGAEIIRLWVAMADTTQDVRISDEILTNTVDSYRRIRNTVRYLLGALDGYSDKEAVKLAEMPGLEQWVLHRLSELDDIVHAAYKRYDFKAVFSQLFHFCTNDLSAFYLDVRKDSLYCDRPDAVRRRAARTVMHLCFERLTVWLAPILSFTMEEAWLSRHGDMDGSVHLQVFPETPNTWRNDALADTWSRLRVIRRVVSGALEIERREKRIGSSLEARPTVFLPRSEDRALIAHEAKRSNEPEDGFFADLLITSQVDVRADEPPAEVFTLEGVDNIGVVAGKAAGKRCARSWRVTPDVGTDQRYPDLSARDADAVAHWDALHD